MDLDKAGFRLVKATCDRDLYGISLTMEMSPHSPVHRCDTPLCYHGDNTQFVSGSDRARDGERQS